MASKCKTCGAPQSGNNNSNCEYCGDTLSQTITKEESISNIEAEKLESELKDFVRIKYEFDLENYEKSLALADKYLEKDHRNIPCWTYKIASEFLLEDSANFSLLETSLNSLLKLKITNNLSQKFIEEIIAGVFYVDKYSDSYGLKSFLEFSSANFSEDFKNKLIKYFIKYFSNAKYDENYIKEIDCPFIPIKIREKNIENEILESRKKFHSRFNNKIKFCEFTDLKPLLIPLNENSKKLISEYFNLILRHVEHVSNNIEEDFKFSYLAFKKEINGKTEWLFNKHLALEVFIKEKEKIEQLYEARTEITEFLNEIISQYDKILNSFKKSLDKDAIIKVIDEVKQNELIKKENIKIAEEKMLLMHKYYSYSENWTVRMGINFILSLLVLIGGIYIYSKDPDSVTEDTRGIIIKSIIGYNILFTIISFFYRLYLKNKTK